MTAARSEYAQRIVIRSPKMQAHNRATEHPIATNPGPVIFMSGIAGPPKFKQRAILAPHVPTV